MSYTLYSAVRGDSAISWIEEPEIVHEEHVVGDTMMEMPEWFLWA